MGRPAPVVVVGVRGEQERVYNERRRRGAADRLARAGLSNADS